jgi:phosphate transport system permease protein
VSRAPDSIAVASAVRTSFESGRGSRALELAFKGALLGCILISLAVLLTLVGQVISEGAGSLSLAFLTEAPSRIDPGSSGIGPALAGTLWLMLVCAAFIVPVGVATAIYLEEYANRERMHVRLIELNIQNLAAVPSIVFGVLGLAFLVRGPLELGHVLLAGGLTLALLVLPVIIVAGREAIRAVPPSIREGSLALGATKWQTIWRQVLPAALPGIATGAILSLSRAIGETAPLIVIGAAAFATATPNGILDTVTALPIQIFSWISDPQDEYKALAAAGIIVLMAILLAMNAVAIWLRNRFEKRW